MSKYRGATQCTFELLKNALGIKDDNVEIINITRTPDDMLRDTFTIIFSSGKETRYTDKVDEGCRFQYKALDVI